MELKKQVLSLLEIARGNSISGAKLAKELFVTRSAIWKAIKALQADGYGITAVTNKGYCLTENNDILSSASITPFLCGQALDMKIEVHKKVDSTNSIAKNLAKNGASQGTVVIAEEQINGRGRLGRAFYSPPSTGVYMSLVLRPKLSLEHSLLITTSVAVAVARAIETVGNVKADIKWVNDIYVNGYKLCGILTEASIDFESGGLEYVIVGIGINVATQKKDFPEELQNIATSIFLDESNKMPIRSKLIAEVLNNISQSYERMTDKEYLDEYRERSFLLGQEILVIQGEKIETALAIEIDEQARLVVEFKDGTRKPLNSGEVSVKKQ